MFFGLDDRIPNAGRVPNENDSDSPDSDAENDANNIDDGDAAAEGPTIEAFVVLGRTIRKLTLSACRLRWA